MIFENIGYFCKIVRILFCNVLILILEIKGMLWINGILLKLWFILVVVYIKCILFI